MKASAHFENAVTMFVTVLAAAGLYELGAGAWCLSAALLLFNLNYPKNWRT